MVASQRTRSGILKIWLGTQNHAKVSIHVIYPATVGKNGELRVSYGAGRSGNLLNTHPAIGRALPSE